MSHDQICKHTVDSAVTPSRTPGIAVINGRHFASTVTQLASQSSLIDSTATHSTVLALTWTDLFELMWHELFDTPQPNITLLESNVLAWTLQMSTHGRCKNVHLWTCFQNVHARWRRRRPLVDIAKVHAWTSFCNVTNEDLKKNFFFEKLFAQEQF
jgi:hypothetical protein